MKMKALVLDAEHRTAHVAEIPKPAPAANEVLVQVHAVALNPVDALYAANPLGATGRVIGSDFAGVVEECGSDVPTFMLGKRVAGFLQGACSVNDRPGAFAEYLVVPWELVWRVPDGMRFEKAATVSLCGLTAAQGLFWRMKMPAPFSWRSEENIVSESGKEQVKKVFIYGASTSVGMFAAQLARQSGLKLRLIGAASTARHDMLRTEPYSYDELVDYRAENWPERVRELCGGQGVDYAVDCISEGDVVENVNSTLGPEGKQAIFRSAEGGAWNQTRPLVIEPMYGAVWEGLGEDVQYQGMTIPASSEARAFAVAFYRYLSTAAEDGTTRLIPNPIRSMPGGLAKIGEDGFVLLGTGSMEDRVTRRTEPWMRPISAEKLVYTLYCS
jgi:NADPH:quinone reductase-like Zn-dependent oxidoreductase